jgi:protein SCO1/2
MAWLNRLQDSASDAAAGHGLAIAIALAILSVAIAVAVATNWRPTPLLGLAILLNLGYWVVGQGFGGMFYTNSATDPNAGPLFVLLALVVYSLTPIGGRLAAFGTARPRLDARARPAALLTPLLAITAAGVAATVILQTPNVAPQPLAAASPFDGQAITPPVLAPPISLRNYLGDPINLGQYQGREQAVLLTFLYTHCPTVCAAVASELRRTLAVMPPSERNRLQIVAVTLDPQNDSSVSIAALLKRSGMTGRMQYLTGSASQLTPIWTQWGITGTSAPDRLDTNSIMYGITPSGEVMTSYSAYFTPQEMLHDVKLLEAL